MTTTDLIARHMIGGSYSDTGDKTASINPATGAVVGHVRAEGAAQATAAIAAARAAFDTTLWPQSPRDRQMALLRWADHFRPGTGVQRHRLHKRFETPLFLAAMLQRSITKV